MKVVDVAGREDLARVFVVQMRDEPWSLVECVGAVDPAQSRADKLVVVVSTQLGCAVGCPMCDAGTAFHGSLGADEILWEIEHVLREWAGPAWRACKKLKVQFARMGEPALNPAVLDVLDQLPSRLQAPGLMPCIATTAPRSATRWFDRLRTLRDTHYGHGMFQLQLSVQSTNEAQRDRLIPIAKWDLPTIAEFSRTWVRPRDRKVTLNFAVTEGVALEPRVLAALFDPASVTVKLTPLNPTTQAHRNELRTVFRAGEECRVDELSARIRDAGFDCIVSTGLAEESEMHTSCGQLVLAHRRTLREEPSRSAEQAPGQGVVW
ncbi:MAG: hypothetical protein MUF54_04145 [Polyangiaceae bacterium]|jgi:23S rRNA (adenine2503-C2)-methyltransferase|nr:hypothetical protein [Polyangiaceae bacterium]